MPTSLTPQTAQRPATDGASAWAEHYARGDGYRWWPCEELVRSVAGRRFGTVLEAGCGNGANLWLLAEHADKVVGVDLCDQALVSAAEHMARRGVRARVALRKGDVHRLPAEDASVDAVVDVMVSQHVGHTHHQPLYAEYRRALRPGGWLFVYHLVQGTSVSHDSEKAADAWTWMRLGLFPRAGLTCLPPAWALRESMESAGFDVAPHRAVVRHYATGETAVYVVMEGEAR